MDISRKEDAHNAIKDCKSILFAIKKMKFDLEILKHEKKLFGIQLKIQ